MEIDRQEPTDSQNERSELRDLIIPTAAAAMLSLNTTEQTLLILRTVEKQSRKETASNMGKSVRQIGRIERRILRRIDLRLSNAISRIPETGTIFDRINLQNRKPLKIPSYK